MLVSFPSRIEANLFIEEAITLFKELNSNLS